MKKVVAAAVCALALTACSPKAATNSVATDSGGVKTDFGVSAKDITLGLLTDKTGVFKNNGLGVTEGDQLWANDVNAKGGICGRQIKFETVDSGYKADTAKTVYPQMEPKILGMLQLLGSPIVAALQSNLKSDNVTALALSWSSQVLNDPHVIVPGTTYDLETINGLEYLRQQGLIKDGDKIGQIYIDGDYGGNALRGAQYYAQKHRMTLVPVKITSSDTDMTGIVTGLRGQGVKAIALTTTPSQTQSAAGASAALGLNVPLLGNNPTFEPALLKSPAAAALDKLYVMTSSVPFASAVPKAKAVADEYKAKYSDPETSSIQYGYANGMIWEQILRTACTNKDLTRAGIQRALHQSKAISTDDLVADLDFSQQGSPATRKVYITKVDPNVAGGLRQLTPLFSAPEAAVYRTPYQK